jgi:hypothetical protein
MAVAAPKPEIIKKGDFPRMDEITMIIAIIAVMILSNCIPAKKGIFL